MRVKSKLVLRSLIGLLAAVGVGAAWQGGGLAWAMAVAAIVALLGVTTWALLKVRFMQRQSVAKQSPSDQSTRPQKIRRSAVPAGDAGSLVEQLLNQGRYALLLRPQVRGNLTPDQLQRTEGALQADMATVPDGPLILACAGDVSEWSIDGEEEPRQVLRVGGFLMDRYPVTNREFAEFVEAGGYEQEDFWNREIWPAVADFLDASGSYGPLFWHKGRCPEGQSEHPVVGINWYEAMAYARWIGKRLPTGAEWEKAGSWPVQLAAGTLLQRKYPWGGNMDRAKANLWGSGPERVTAVTEYAGGVSLGGVHQLIGNVWEWTEENFGEAAGPCADLVLPAPMKTIRGGAFDTYFDNQATCQYQSGESPMSRKHNIGFRCVIAAKDLQPSASPEQIAGDESTEIVANSPSNSDNRPAAEVTA